MSTVSVMVLFLLGISMLVTGFMLAYALKKNYHKGQFVRKQLAERVDELRYGRILALFGIDKKAFLQCPVCEMPDLCLTRPDVRISMRSGSW